MLPAQFHELNQSLLHKMALSILIVNEWTFLCMYLLLNDLVRLVLIERPEACQQGVEIVAKGVYIYFFIDEIPPKLFWCTVHASPRSSVSFTVIFVGRDIPVQYFRIIEIIQFHFAMQVSQVLICKESVTPRRKRMHKYRPLLLGMHL